jgi:hypothetical protein
VLLTARDGAVDNAFPGTAALLPFFSQRGARPGVQRRRRETERAGELGPRGRRVMVAAGVLCSEATTDDLLALANAISPACEGDPDTAPPVVASGARRCASRS